MTTTQKNLDVLIVGGGLAGISAYLEAKKYPEIRAGLVEYEGEIGGELRYYPGFTEARNVRNQFHATSENSTEIRLRTTAVGVLPAYRTNEPLEVSVSSSKGTETIRTQTLLICTGMFDSPRENNRIPGQRPAGVVTPSFVVRVLEEGALPGYETTVYIESRRDIEVAKRLAQAGVKLVAILGTEAVLTMFKNDIAELGVPTFDTQRVSYISGIARLTSITVENSRGEYKQIDCDSLVFAGGRHSCTFALKGSDVEMSSIGGISVDENGLTSIPCVYAAGSCVTLDPNHEHSSAQGRQVMKNIVRALSKA